MPKQVWDRAAGKWTQVPDGIQVGGTSFTDQSVVKDKLTEKSLLPDARNQTVVTVINAMIADVFSAQTWKEVYDEIVGRIKNLAPTKDAWLGKSGNGYTEWSQIPLNYRTALKNLIDNGNPAPGHDRGAHTVNPMKIQGNVQETLEYDLESNRNGRATRVKKQGVYAYYYSTGHAAATYSYYLIVRGDKPVLRGAIDGINKVTLTP
jgi:hypothetical protein